MKKSPSTILLISLIILSLSSCNREPGESGSTEADYIKYKVIYLEKMAGDIPTSMLPDVMHAYYNKGHVLTRIDGFFGAFSLVQVANLKRNVVTTRLNFFGNKIFYTGRKGELPAGIFPLNDPRINYTEDTLTISGLLSYKATVEYPDSSYEIFYTKEIEISEPNITTPYSFIDYVLSDFRVQLSYLKMRLIIDHHERDAIDPAMFEIPDDYKQVSKETMEDIINSLFTKE